VKQRINLYNSDKPKQKFELLSLNGSLTVAIAVLSLALLTGLGLTWYASAQEKQFAQLQQTKIKLDKQIAAEELRFSDRDPQPELIAEQQRIKDQIAAKTALKGLLHKVQPEYRANFSGYLYDLSNASVSESWLNEFVLDNETSLFHARGAAVNGPAVSTMIETLGQTGMFQGMSVTTLNVTAVETGVSFDTSAELSHHE